MHGVENVHKEIDSRGLTVFISWDRSDEQKRETRGGKQADADLMYFGFDM